MVSLPLPRVSSSDVWLSAHVHHSDRSIYGPSGDEIVLSVVPRCLEALTSKDLLLRWFFIRYGEHGSHIRLRVLVAGSEVQYARALLKSALSSELEAGAKYAVRFAEYEPEIDRYGGTEAMRSAESVFCASSEYVSEVLPGLIGRPRSERVGRALLATMVTLFELNRERPALVNCASKYAEGYCLRVQEHAPGASDFRLRLREEVVRQHGAVRRGLRGVMETLEAGHLLPQIRGYQLAIREAIRTLHCLGDVGALRGAAEELSPTAAKAYIRQVICSHVHMTNNRIGVSIRDEALVAALISSVFDESTSSKASAI